MIICYNFERKSSWKGAFCALPNQREINDYCCFFRLWHSRHSLHIFYLALAMRMPLALASAEPAAAASANSWRAKA